MRILSVYLENFASYKKLNFEFNEQGLSLIHGATGSGKSTLCDAIPWVLFGKTAKGGAVNEVLSWPGDSAAWGRVGLYTMSGTYLCIDRKRGVKSKDNDLWYATEESCGMPIRGKDMQDTQKIISQLLNIDVDLYLAGAYYHEFSQTAQFFTTTAKNRRMICEQLVDLSLSLKLQDKIKANMKEVYSLQDSHRFDVTVLEAQLKTLNRMQTEEHGKAKNWDSNQALRVGAMETRVLQFEDRRAIRVDQVLKQATEKAKSKICSECGAVKQNHTHDDKSSGLEIIRIEEEENPYVAQLRELKSEVNPHTGGVKDFSDEVAATKVKLSFHQGNLMALLQEEGDYTILQDSVSHFRSLLIKNTISDIQDKTNLLLSQHFDAEIKIELSVEDSDKLNVTIQKDGNEASFTQLSKGQRQMLKLCFGTAVMETVSNHHGVDFKQIFFDEATDGMDEVNKLRAIRMLESLAINKAVYIVEHSSEVKAHVDNKFEVELVNGTSVIHG